MITDISNKMRFGFEIEGLFTQYLVDDIDEVYPGGEWKEDGSVNEDNCIKSFKNVKDGYLSGYTEYASPVLDIEGLKSLLPLFNSHNGYYWDKQEYSTGLHLHLSLEGVEKNKLFFLASDWQAFSRLQKHIKTYAKYHSVNLYRRLKGNTYYYSPYDYISFIYGLYSGEKYKFMRFHPQGTLEFRFLAPHNDMLKDVLWLARWVGKNLFLQEKKTDYSVVVRQRQFSDTQTIREKLNF